MKSKKLIILFLIVFLLSGCTKILKDADGKVVKNEQSGLNLTENILCLPNNKETIEIYTKAIEDKKEKLLKKLDEKDITKKQYKNEISKITDISSLQKCSNFSINSGGYEGIWTTIFVKPLAWLIIKLGECVKNYGLAVIIITFLIRLALYPITNKTAMQSENMAKAKKDLDNLEKKYNNKTDKDSMMQKSQEMMLIYKKYDINPAAGCIFSMIQIPIFFAFYEALNRLPVILEGKFLSFQMGLSPMQALKNGNYLYLIFVVLVILVTYFSFKLNQTAAGSSEQQKQMQSMMKFMVVFIGIASFSISVAIALYWITNSGFTVVQNLLVKRGKKNDNIIKNK